MIKFNKRRKIIAVFTLVLLSVLFGIFIYSKLESNHLAFIMQNVENLNYMNFKVILFHILLLSLSFVFSFFAVGILFLLLYLCFEGIVIGFMCAYFVSIYHLKGIFYSLTYLLIYKVILLFLILILALKFLKLTKSLIRYIKKEKIDITKTILNVCIVCIAILINDFILIFFGSPIFNFICAFLK